jgi:hypothetical protein
MMPTARARSADQRGTKRPRAVRGPPADNGKGPGRQQERVETRPADLFGGFGVHISEEGDGIAGRIFENRKPSHVRNLCFFLQNGGAQ